MSIRAKWYGLYSSARNTGYAVGAGLCFGYWQHSFNAGCFIAIVVCAFVDSIQDLV